jgi:hypothetical protein
MPPIKNSVKRAKGKAEKSKAAKNYKHREAESLMRPEVGVQAQFKKKLPPKTYRYDSSLSPALDWDGQNPVRERGDGSHPAGTGSGDLGRGQGSSAEIEGDIQAFSELGG